MSMAATTMKRVSSQSNSRPKRLRLKLTVIIEQDDGAWHAFCPALKGLHVDGDTQAEALTNAIEAAKVYINSLAMHRRESLPNRVGFLCRRGGTNPNCSPWGSVASHGAAMAFSKQVWNQLKSITADELIAALKRDGYVQDPASRDATIAYIKTSSPAKRVVIHYHPQKTYRPKLLKGLLGDIG